MKRNKTPWPEADTATVRMTCIWGIICEFRDAMHQRPSGQSLRLPDDAIVDLPGSGSAHMHSTASTLRWRGVTPGEMSLQRCGVCTQHEVQSDDRTHAHTLPHTPTRSDFYCNNTNARNCTQKARGRSLLGVLVC